MTTNRIVQLRFTKRMQFAPSADVHSVCPCLRSTKSSALSSSAFVNISTNPEMTIPLMRMALCRMFVSKFILLGFRSPCRAIQLTPSCSLFPRSLSSCPYQMKFSLVCSCFCHIRSSVKLLAHREMLIEFRRTVGWCVWKIRLEFS
jgi:hypothetical protein